MAGHRTKKEIMLDYHDRMRERCVVGRLDDEKDAGRMLTGKTKLSKRLARKAARRTKREHDVNDYFDSQASEDIMDSRRLDTMNADDLYEDDREGMEVQKEDAPEKHTSAELEYLNSEIMGVIDARLGGRVKKVGHYKEESAHPTIKRTHLMAPVEIAFERLFNPDDDHVTIMGAFSPEFEQKVMDPSIQKYADTRTFLCLCEPLLYMEPGDETHTCQEWKYTIERSGGAVMHEIVSPDGCDDRTVIYARLAEDIFVGVVLRVHTAGAAGAAGAAADSDTATYPSDRQYYWYTHCFLHAQERTTAY